MPEEDGLESLCVLQQFLHGALGQLGEGGVGGGKHGEGRREARAVREGRRHWGPWRGLRTVPFYTVTLFTIPFYTAHFYTLPFYTIPYHTTDKEKAASGGNWIPAASRVENLGSVARSSPVVGRPAAGENARVEEVGRPNPPPAGAGAGAAPGAGAGAAPGAPAQHMQKDATNQFWENYQSKL